MFKNTTPSKLPRRLLIISRNFPPLVGGMERLILNAVRQLDHEFECDVIGPQGCSEYLNEPRRGFGCRIAPLPWFFLCAAWRALRNGLRTRYRLCLAGSGVTAPIAVGIGKLLGIPSLVFIHGLDLIAPYRLYQWLFVPFIRRADGIIANSHNTAVLARARGIEQIDVIFPGTELPATLPDPAPFIERYGLAGKKILLSVGRVIPRKGLAEFVEYSLGEIVRAYPDVVLLVVGDEPKQALQKNSQYILQLQEAVTRNGLQQHVQFTGKVDDETLRMTYCAATAFVFPLRPVPGDVEGFGMVAVEAAAHGLPTVAFAEGGVIDAVAQDLSGKLVASGDYTAFTRAVSDVLDNHSISAQHCREFAARFSWDHYGEHLRAVCRRYVDVKNQAKV